MTTADFNAALRRLIAISLVNEIAQETITTFLAYLKPLTEPLATRFPTRSSHPFHIGRFAIDKAG